MAAVNDFVLRFANVNGTGSASANSMVAKALYRMGLFIGPKNMFPSNIQGLPTWYEVRVSERGYTGRRGGVDLLVAMNPQTFEQDLRELLPKSYVMVDSTKNLDKTKYRKDIQFLEIPLTKMCLPVFPNPKSRAMLKNIVYVGALSYLLKIPIEIFRKLLEEQFAKKIKLLEGNYQALEMGFNYAKENFSQGLEFYAQSPTGNGARNKILLEGNAAAGLGCVYAGATVAAWYPITPSTSLIDAFAKFCQKTRMDSAGKNKFTILQAEDELAAIGMVLGANWMGARAFTATSGPGISLMQEFLGFAYYAEVPVVLFDVQRVGPSTGMPTRTQQSDLLSCAFASHGDTKHILLIPANPKECFEMAVAAFDLAELFQTPVIVMSDLEIGMNEWLVDPLEWKDDYSWERGKVLDKEKLDALANKAFYRYMDENGDGLVSRTLPGAHPSKGSYFTRGSGHDKFGRYTEDSFLFQENLDRLLVKWKTAKEKVPQAIWNKNYETLDSAQKEKLGIIYYGSTDEALKEALDLCREEDGIQLDSLRIRSFPFSSNVVSFLKTCNRVLIIEQNRDAQLRTLLQSEYDFSKLSVKVQSLLLYDGMPLIASKLKSHLKIFAQEQQLPEPEAKYHNEIEKSISWSEQR